MDGFFYSLLDTLCGGIVGFFKFYIVLLTIRVYLTWFPNINFYIQPFSSIGKMTDPYLRLFRGLIPPLLGFDLSPLLAFLFLTFLIDIFGSVQIT
jgi:YggT family protein